MSAFDWNAQEGLVAGNLFNDKKVYKLTEDGVTFLEQNRSQVEELFERLEETGKGFERGRQPEIMRAFRNLRGAVVARVVRGNATQEQIQKIAERINAAAKSIDDL